MEMKVQSGSKGINVNGARRQCDKWSKTINSLCNAQKRERDGKNDARAKTYGKRNVAGGLKRDCWT